jgi:undecaprenyl-diphosphatase
MLIWLEILILAVVQGVTEFLPISSSGHLVIGSGLFGLPLDDQEKLTVNVLLHAGTLLAILVFYRQRIWQLLHQDRRVIGLLLVGSLPAAVAGLILKHQFAGLMTNPLTAGCMLPITGLMLLWTARRKTGETTCGELGYGRSLVIGVFQAFAILPGISRSGATIVAGLGVGMRRDEAATFSFLLAIPAIGGAALLDLKGLLDKPPQEVPAAALAVGALVSFVVGLVSLWWLVRWLQQGRLYLFAWWVIPVGLAVIAWQLLIAWPLL